jgi:8-oxoguanine DNA glycosylase-like protein
MRLSDFRDLIANMPVSYQAFKSKRSTWAKYARGNGSAASALRSIFGESEDVTMSRSDLRRLAMELDKARFVIATIIWGYPRGMRGNHVARLVTQLQPLTRLLSSARAQPLTDWNAHYEAVSAIAGIGLSTYTKFLTFLSVNVHGHGALILDDRIIRVANQAVFEELAPIRQLSTHNAVRSYPEYLSCVHGLADTLAVSAEKVEFFLFEFGLNLKPT